MNKIKYHDGYKYQLVEDYSIDLITIYPESINLWKPKQIVDEFIILTDGLLSIMRGYAWDGPSGPAIDTHNFMRGSLVHDALYQLIRDGHLKKEVYRVVADEVLYRICREDGMTKIRALWVYYGVRFGGNDASRVLKKVHTSP